MKIEFLEQSVCGERLGTYNCDGFRLLELSYQPGHEMPRHTHDLPYVEFHIDGSYTERCGNVERSLIPQTVALHPAGEEHSERYHSSGARGFFLEIKPRLARAIRDYEVGLSNFGSWRGGAVAGLMTQLYREFHFMDSVAPLAMEGLIFEIVAGLSRQHAQSTSRRPAWLNQTQELLHARFADQLTIAAIARDVAVHPSHLTRAFRENFHCTIGEYIRRLRIEFATYAISTSDRSLVDIALEAGFADHSHFSRVFRRHTGLTPSVFRQSLRRR